MNGSNGLEKIQEVVMGWSDWAAFGLIVLLGLVLMIGVLRWVAQKDKEAGRENKQDNCKSHKWFRNRDSKLICKECGKIPGVKNKADSNFNGFSGP